MQGETERGREQEIVREREREREREGRGETEKTGVPLSNMNFCKLFSPSDPLHNQCKGIPSLYIVNTCHLPSYLFIQLHTQTPLNDVSTRGCFPWGVGRGCS